MVGWAQRPGEDGHAPPPLPLWLDGKIYPSIDMYGSLCWFFTVPVPVVGREKHDAGSVSRAFCCQRPPLTFGAGLLSVTSTLAGKSRAEQEEPNAPEAWPIDRGAEPKAGPVMSWEDPHAPEMAEKELGEEPRWLKEGL